MYSVVWVYGDFWFLDEWRLIWRREYNAYARLLDFARRNSRGKDAAVDCVRRISQWQAWSSINHALGKINF